MQRKRPVDRPKNLNLLTIRMPVNAIVSIMHRASGVMLFLVTPFILLLLQMLLANQSSYDALAGFLMHWPSKLLMIGLSWAFFHHFFAGIRHLVMDAHWMKSLHQARFSSRVVLGLTVIAVILFAGFIW